MAICVAWRLWITLLASETVGHNTVAWQEVVAYQDLSLLLKGLKGVIGGTCRWLLSMVNYEKSEDV